MTGLELNRYREWLAQRHLLANPGTFMWTWVQTHLPDWYTSLVYEKSPQAGFAEPVGPLPEQVRLLTYTALAGGAKGLGFWSDRFLADSHQGRDRLLEMALLNQEIQMLEPLLVAAEQPVWVETNVPEVRAAVFRTEKAVLVLPVWVGFGAQFVPGQAAKAKLTVVVPQVPVGTQAWQVSPGDVRSLVQERVAGGTKITLPEFAQTAAVVFTADNGKDGLVVHLQDQARRMRKLAAQWTHDLAVVEYDKVARVNAELEAMGHKLDDGQDLLSDSRRRIEECVKRWSEGDYREAYLEAQRAMRPLGIVMRAQWEEAAKQLDLPVASPYALSYFTLPRHWKFADDLLTSSVVPNVLPHGDFEELTDNPAEAWAPQEVKLDAVEMEARRCEDDPKEGKECLKLEIKPKNTLFPPGALERTFLALQSPAVRLQPGSLVRISGWVKVPKDITSSADGALMYDSAGGEPLAFRFVTSTKKWRQFTWYRRVPPSGKLSLTVALTGLGSAYFDDLKIEPLQPGSVAMPPEDQRSLRSPKPPPDEDEKKDDKKDDKKDTARGGPKTPSSKSGVVQAQAVSPRR